MKRAKTGGRFAMECWNQAGWPKDSEGRERHEVDCWEPMHEGPAKAAWRPKPSAVEAALQCTTWTGGCFMPTMRVVDLQTGEVLWQRTARPPHNKERAGPDIDLPEAEQRALEREWARVRAEWRAEGLANEIEHHRRVGRCSRYDQPVQCLVYPAEVAAALANPAALPERQEELVVLTHSTPRPQPKAAVDPRRRVDTTAVQESLL